MRHPMTDLINVLCCLIAYLIIAGIVGGIARRTFLRNEKDVKDEIGASMTFGFLWPLMLFFGSVGGIAYLLYQFGQWSVSAFVETDDLEPAIKEKSE